MLNTSLAARPASTGEYANRVTQYEFVREFFTSNTISVFIDTAFVLVFLLVIYAIAGWLAIIPAIAFVVCDRRRAWSPSSASASTSPLR